MPNNLMENLNPEQLKAVLHKAGPLLIVAGAGTGKTTVITQRIAYIIEQGWAKPDEILALTFTEKAAAEMEERVAALLPVGYFDLWISTFHSFGERILKDRGLAIGLSLNFKLLNEFEQWALVKKNLDKFDLDYYRPLGNPTKFIQALLKHFSRAKDEDINPRQYLEYANELRENLDNMLSGVRGRKRGNFQFPISNFQTNSKPKIKNKKNKIVFLQSLAMTDKGEFNKEIAEQEVARINEVANAYHVYQQLLLDNNALDFGDLINYCLKLFKERPAILQYYQGKFKFILLDEFQDTNWAQYELIKLLVNDQKNLVVVGDDDQCLPGGSLILTQQGKKRIDKIKPGEKVATAVGKGYLSYGRVNQVMKNIKQAKLITFITAGGSEITVTDNHKMFGRVLSDRKNHQRYYYVYLMYKQELGWRLGMTNDLLTRLKIERSADLLVALKVFSSEAEARYNETLLSLKYGIPTVCFQERDGIMTKKIWSEKLYEDLDVDLAVKRLAADLGIDLRAHQVCLAGVNRGGKVRIKINLEMCFRNYRSKYAKDIFLANPKVLHQLTVETSHQPTLKILKKIGFNLVKAKGGYRLKLASADLPYLGNIAMQIQKATGGIIENQIKIATNNIQHKKALVIPAGNILPGMFLPVVKDNKIIYEQIIKRRDRKKKLAVYDLEVDLTHNFVADDIIVHNSIYKFRGASLSNILQFKKDFPESKEIILTKNYRNQQNILDLSYNFIQLNNPNRLEYQLNNNNVETPRKCGASLPNASLPNVSKNASNNVETRHGVSLRGSSKNKLNKKLVAQNKGQGEIEVIFGQTLEAEVKQVIAKIVELKIKDKNCSWNDFAILVRANDSAKDFINELERAELPFIFGSSRGLYLKPLIIDLIAYLKLLDNYHESRAMYRVLNWPIFDFSYQELVNFNYLAYKKAWSLYEVLTNANLFQFSPKLTTKINQLVVLIDKHTALVSHKTISEVLLAALNDSGYLKYLTTRDEPESQEVANLLNQFMKRVKAFEASSDDKSVKAFLEELTMEMEAGEEGSLAPDLEAGPEAIRILTVHGAKGLEFKYVFIANLVDKRFPTIERQEQIELPDALVKEILPIGDIHLEEERRLFYVGMTRAKNGLYFSWARDYGGARDKKPSRFLEELDLVDKSYANNRLSSVGQSPISNFQFPISKQIQNSKLQIQNKNSQNNFGAIPSYFSYTQLAAFSSCPYQYRFAHILKIPVAGKEQFSFGKTLHITLQKLFSLIKEKQGFNQADLFGNKTSPNPLLSKEGSKECPASAGRSGLISLDEVLKLYKESWIDDWYESKNKKEIRRQQGKEILTVFYEKHKDSWPQVLYLEKGFNIKLPDNGAWNTVRGTIDRIDQIGDKIKIIDYKTGRPKDKLTFEKKEQLLIYQLAISELFSQPIASLSFYYLDNNSEVEFLGDKDDLAKIKEKITATIAEIKQGQFLPRPSQLCKFCDFRDICEFRKI